VYPKFLIYPLDSAISFSYNYPVNTQQMYFMLATANLCEISDLLLFVS